MEFPDVGRMSSSLTSPASLRTVPSSPVSPLILITLHAEPVVYASSEYARLAIHIEVSSGSLLQFVFNSSLDGVALSGIPGTSTEENS